MKKFEWMWIILVAVTLFAVYAAYLRGMSVGRAEVVEEVIMNCKGEN